MINLIFSPQRSEFKADYQVDNDVLAIRMGEVEETFDFTEFEEGKAKEIIVEELPINPIVSVEKTGEEINIKVIRFYTFDEKGEFENGNNQMEN